MDLEAAGEVALARLVDANTVGADRARRESRASDSWKRAELRERDRMRDDQPSAAVGHLEAIDRSWDVGVLAAGDLADHAADRDLVPGPIGRPVGVDVGARGQSLRDLVGNAQSRNRRRAARP